MKPGREGGATARTVCGRLSRLALLIAALACSSEPSASTTPSHIDVVAGDAQLADVRDVLPQLVRFVVTDNRGRPVGGIPVTLIVTIGGGSVPAAQQVTGADGTIETRWTTGSMAGVQELQAQVSPSLFASATAATCLPGDCYPESRLDGPVSDATLLSLATYEGSGQTVHPDIVHGHGAASGFWLAITPYPGGDATHENPSIFGSADGEQWAVPTGVTNPLALPSGVFGYQSDPDIIFNSSDQRLWMYYRSYTLSENTINVIRSTNGRSWDAPTIVLTAPAHQVVSPSIVRAGRVAPWEMWAVNAGPQGCSAGTTTVERRSSIDGLNWSAATVTDLAQPGQVIWHIDVEWIPARSEYWAVYNTYPTGGSCATHSLYLARSSDGTHWTVSPSPIARSGLIPAFSDIIYRSTFLANTKGTRILLVMSGASFTNEAGYVWRTASVSTTADALLAIAAAPAPTVKATYRALPPPEGDVGH